MCFHIKILLSLCEIVQSCSEFSDCKKVFDGFHIDENCFFHTRNQDKLIGSVDTVINSLFFRSESNDVFQGFGISAASDDYRFMFSVTCYICVGFIQCGYERRFFWEE